VTIAPPAYTTSRRGAPAAIQAAGKPLSKGSTLTFRLLRVREPGLGKARSCCLTRGGIVRAGQSVGSASEGLVGYDGALLTQLVCK
jgi:hypothetical protein